MNRDNAKVSARRLTALLASTAIVLHPFGVLAGDALPTGGQVVSGSASIGISGTTMTVTQGSDRAIVNWDGFSVGVGSSVTFVQPGSSSAILNRVTGSTPSTIAGAVTGNGQVYLINPNGIAITPTGTVRVGGGFVASTLDISNDDFLAGHYRFGGDGSSAGVSNQGVITVGRGGYAALIGGTVKNDGMIAVPMGKVGLGSGEQATLDLSGDGFLQVAVPTADGAEGTGALIENGGSISAEGGTVVMQAATARHAARHAVNLSGTVEANSVSGRDGAIVIGGGEGGEVSLSGTLSSKSSAGTGGKVTVTGKSVALKGATVDASGATGGGTVRIGGDYKGQGALQRAATTTVDSASTIRADATQSGDGGSIVVWSDDQTRFSGLITAMGAGSGKGGDAEVSGKARLAYTGFANLSGPGGFGTLLLDPYNITISSDADSNVSGFSANGNNSVLNVTTLTHALAGANVAVTTGMGGSQTGDIAVNSAISWAANTTLTLSAANNIAINADITATGAQAGLVLNYGDYANNGSAPSSTYYSIAPGASITLSGANSSLAINGTGYTLIRSRADLEAVNNNLGGAYALAGDLDLSGVTYTDAVIANGNWFTGSFAGLGHVISDLTINSTGDFVGLFGRNNGSIRDLGVLRGSVSGNHYVGGLVGASTQGTISNAYATGAVSGVEWVGGLVGVSDSGTIRNVYATAVVTGGGNYVGGLVGYSVYDWISNAYATGAVTGFRYVGGLVGGQIGGTINNAHATGAVTSGNNDAGGLVGSLSSGTISDSYATGAVSGGARVGGLVGNSGGGTISNAHATGVVTGLGNYVGGLVGVSSGDSISNAYATGAVTGTSLVGGLAGGSSSGSLSHVYATGAVTGGNDSVGGLVGELAGGALGDAYATGAVSGRIRVGGLVGSSAGGAISNVYATGVVTGSSDYVGGLVGSSTSDSISDAYATGAVSGVGWVGGLVGEDFNGSITNAHATGDVTGGYRYAGGLVGYTHLGRISNAYATGAVSGDGRIGGLVGYSLSGSISNAYATGTVTAINDIVGGLVGYHLYGTISTSYATGAVSAKNSVGGLVGKNETGTISDVYATGIVSGTEDYVGGLVGAESNGTISNAYATGAVSGRTSVGGLLGVSGGGTINASFFNSDTTGQTLGVGSGTSTGVTGLTTAQMSDLSIFAAAGWDIDGQGGTGTIWRIYDGYTAPLIRSFLTSLTVTANDVTKTYDGLSFAGGNGVRYSGFVNGDTASVLGGALSFGGSSQGALNAGTYALTASGLYSTFYDISYVDGALTVNRAGLTVTANDDAKTYDGLAYAGGNGVSYAGFVNGETASVLGGALSFGGTSQGALNAGSYVLSASGLTAANYDISYVDGALTVNRAGLTVTANDDTKTYDGLAYTGGNGVTYAGFVNGETASVLGGALNFGGTSQGALNAGGYVLSASGLTSGNYDISYVDGALTVHRAGLTVTANDDTKTYDGLAYAGGNGVTYAGFVNGETASVLGGALNFGGTSQGALNAGSYVLSASGLTSGNYDISYVDGLLTVNRAGLTVTANDDTKTYDGLAYAGGNGVTYSGFVNGETASVLGGALSFGGTSQGALNAGSYVLSASGLTSGNYDISYVDGSLTVNRAGLTVTANDDTKTYDGLTYAGGNGVTYAGFVNGETASVLGGTLSFGGNSQGALNAGSYVLSASGLTSGNYDISYVDGALTVNRAGLTVTANDDTKTYDGVAYSGGNGVTYAGFVNGETASVLGGALSFGGSSQGALNAGSYVLSASGLTSGNYDISYVDGSLTVTPRAISITADDNSKIYGDSVSLGYTISGGSLVNGDSLSGSLASAGTAVTASVGRYAITQGTLANANYDISFVDGALTVTPRALSITADDRSKIYGDSVSLGYTISGGSLVNGDSLSGSLASAGTALSASVGRYAINQGTLANANYDISYIGGILTVTPASLTITADSGSVDFGSSIPALGYSVAGWRNGQDGSLLSGVVVSSDATSSSAAGRYATRASNGILSGAAAGNYRLVYVDGVLTVAPQFGAQLLQTIVRPFNPAINLAASLDTRSGFSPSSPIIGAVASGSGGNGGAGGTLSVEDPQLSGAVCALGPNLAIAC